MKLIAKFCILIITLLSIQELTAQTGRMSQATANDNQRCHATEIHEAKYASDPEYRVMYDLKMEELDEIRRVSATQQRVNCTNPIIIPVAVHYQGVTNQSLGCLEELALSQVAVLNEDYSASNTDVANYCDDVSNSSLDMQSLSWSGACIQFCLANMNHPASVGLSDGEWAVTINRNYGDFTSIWGGYLNIFVQEGTGVLGYSPLFGSANGDGIVIEACVMGRQGSGCGSGIGPGSGCFSYNEYNLGRTATHEVGHYLGLPHIWGGGCGSDDGFGDTPNSNGPYYGCPNQGSGSCGSNDMYMNYMDYTDDACMYTFSEGQATLMYNVAQNNWGTTSNKCSTLPGYPDPELPGGCDPNALNISFVAEPTTGCTGTEVEFTNFSTGAISTYSWDFGNGNTSDEQTPPSQVYDEVGNYTVTLTIGDGQDAMMQQVEIIIGEGGTFDHLNGGALTIVDAGPYGATSGYLSGTNSFNDEAKAEFFAEGLASSILGDVDFYFDRVSTNSNSPNIIFRVWDDENGRPGAILATETVPATSISTSGVFTLNFGLVELNGPFYVGFELTNLIGEDIIIKSNSDGETVPTTAWELWENGTWYPFNDYTNSNTTWEADVALAIYATFACSLTEEPPVAAFTADPRIVCLGDEVSFTDESTNSPTSWFWDFGDETTSTMQNPVHTYGAPGMFTVELVATNDFGTDSETKTEHIEVRAVPEGFAAVASADAICNGENVDISIAGSFGSECSWEVNGVPIVPTGSFTDDPSITTTYTITCDDGVCSASEEVIVIVHSPQQPSISEDGAELTATSSTSGNWQWYLNGNAIPNATSAIYTAQETGTYTVELTDNFGCVVTSEEVSVTVSAIIDKELNDGLSVYPNPASKLLTVGMSGSFQNSFVLTLIDASGRAVLESEMNEAQIELDISNLSRGAYVLRIEDADGRMAVRQIVKE